MLVALEIVYMTALALLVWMPFGIALTLFLIGFIGTAPTAALYLIFVAALPPSWSHKSRRAVAVALSPLIGAFLYLIAPVGFFVLPGALLYGSLVRLPEAPRSRVLIAQYRTPTR